jgi:2'-5' RNA ligase
MRLFVSLDLAPHLHQEVQSVQELLADASGLRFIDPTQAHITLKFLGDVEESRLDVVSDAISDAVETANIEPFQAEFGDLGVFPDLDYISVVWLGVRDGSEQVTTLHESLEDELTAIGFEPEDHDFTPHVTIARMDHAGGKSLVQEVVQERSPTVGRMTVDTISLTESTLTPDGPEYEAVERFDLDNT